MTNSHVDPVEKILLSAQMGPGLYSQNLFPRLKADTVDYSYKPQVLKCHKETISSQWSSSIIVLTVLNVFEITK